MKYDIYIPALTLDFYIINAMIRKRFFRIFIFILVIGIFLLPGCSSINNRMVPPEKNIPIRKDARLDFLSSNGKFLVSIIVEIPENAGDITRGLMGPRTMNLSEGMLFIFPVAEPQQFWMRNTRMSLDMIFIDESKKVINICSHTRPMSDNTYHSARPAKYVLEVLAGFAELNGIVEGCQVTWELL